MDKYNGNKFSIYDSEEKSVLKLLKKLGDIVNNNINILKNKTDLYGDHKGSWQGIPGPQWAEPGIAGVVDKLTKLMTLELISDIDGTEHKKGDLVDVDNIIRLQQINYSKIMRTLKKNETDTNETVNIICRGDSLTYGYDIKSSDKRPSVGKPNDKGTTQTTTIASVTYPEALFSALKLFNKDITVENLGISGTTCEGSFEKYYKARKDSLEIIMLGTNDSRNTNYQHHGDIERFITYYEQLIIRSTLWGNAIIMVQPPSNYYMRDLNIETYRTAIKKLADKYCITLLDASEMTTGLPFTHWSDQTHFTGLGYKHLGYSIANAIAIQDPNQPLLIQANSVLLTRPTEDSCKFFGNANYSMSTVGYTPFSFLGSDGKTPGRGIGKFVGEGKIIYTFKTTEDNLIVLPTLFCHEDSSFKITLDHGLQQSCTPLGTTQYEFTEFDNNRPSEIIITGGERNAKFDYRKNKKFDEMLFINHKGWHSLTIEVENGEMLNDGHYNVVYGVEFISVEDWSNMTRYNKYEKLYHSENEINTPTQKGTKITLNKNMDEYDFLIISYNNLGIEPRVVDFKINTSITLRSYNLSNEENEFDIAFNEVNLKKIDEYNILVDFNKSVTLRNNGGNLSLSNTGNESLAEIRTIMGVKV